jgi:hypothetical protein
MKSASVVEVIVWGAALLAAACDVTANPFEFGTGPLSSGDDMPDAGQDSGDAGGTDAGCVGKLEAEPPSVDFGLVTTGCFSKETPLTVKNVGCAMVWFRGFYADPVTAPFDIYSEQMVPFPLEPGTETALVLQYGRAGENGTESAVLHIQTSVGDLTVPLRGTAAATSEVLDTFTQGSPPSGSFHLSRWPDPATLEVKVNGGVVPEGGGGWSHDEGGNNVVFGPGAVPAPGAEIAVAYEAMCF